MNASRRFVWVETINGNAIKITSANGKLAYSVNPSIQDTNKALESRICQGLGIQLVDVMQRARKAKSIDVLLDDITIPGQIPSISSQREAVIHDVCVESSHDFAVDGDEDLRLSIDKQLNGLKDELRCMALARMKSVDEGLKRLLSATPIGSPSNAHDGIEETTFGSLKMPELSRSTTWPARKRPNLRRSGPGSQYPCEDYLPITVCSRVYRACIDLAQKYADGVEGDINGQALLLGNPNGKNGLLGLGNFMDGYNAFGREHGVLLFDKSGQEEVRRFMNHPGMIVVNGNTSKPCGHEFFLNGSEMNSSPDSVEQFECLRKSLHNLVEQRKDVVVVMISPNGDISVLMHASDPKETLVPRTDQFCSSSSIGSFRRPSGDLRRPSKEVSMCASCRKLSDKIQHLENELERTQSAEEHVALTEITVSHDSFNEVATSLAPHDTGMCVSSGTDTTHLQDVLRAISRPSNHTKAQSVLTDPIPAVSMPIFRAFSEPANHAETEPVHIELPLAIDRAVLDHTIYLARDYASRPKIHGTVLIVGQPAEILGLGKVGMINAFELPHHLYVQNAAHRQSIMRYMDHDGMIVIDGNSGQPIAHGFFSKQVSRNLNSGGSRSRAARWIAERTSAVVIKISEDARGKFTILTARISCNTASY